MATFATLAAATATVPVAAIASLNGGVPVTIGGSGSLSSSNIQDALGYTPADPSANLTFTGANINFDAAGSTFLRVGATGGGQIAINGPNTSNKSLVFQTGGLFRWRLTTIQNTELGSNTGSALVLRAFDDSGTSLGDVFSVTRISRVMNFLVAPTIAGNTIFHTGNDGAGSTLDADTLRGTTPSAFALTTLDDTSASAMAGTIGTWRVLAASGVLNSHTGTTGEVALATVSLPGGELGPNGILRITAVFSYTNNANIKTFRFRLGGVSGTEFLNFNQTTSSGFMTQRIIQNRNSQSSQIGAPLAIVNSWGPGVTPPTGTIDTSTAQDIVISAQLANAADTVTLESYVIEVAYRP